MGFNCSTCSADFTVRIDILARSIDAEYSDGNFPEDISLDGLCHQCGKYFKLEGEMFSHFVKAKIEEAVISDEAYEYELTEVEVSPEEFEEYSRLVKLGDQEKLNAFVLMLLNRD